MSDSDSSSPSAAPLPVVVRLMLRAAGAPDFKPAGEASLAALPAQGAVVEIARGDGLWRGTVEAIFMPPGCDEHCIATVFVAL